MEALNAMSVTRKLGAKTYQIAMHLEIALAHLKPIFQCDAKPFALGTFASPNAKDSTFASPNAKISRCWYLLR